MTDPITFERVLENMPLIAILRGILPREAIAIGEALYGAGFLSLEVPLNSPEPLSSIAKLREEFDGKMLIGAGTVLSVVDVGHSQVAGAQFMVSPNVNTAVISATKTSHLISIPGFQTPTEAFAARDAGADALKLFPAETTPPNTLNALQAVLPMGWPVIPVGGINPSNINAYLAAGAAGFGIGAALYAPGIDPDALHQRAIAFVEALETARNRHKRLCAKRS
jgi:2-dehydro-3-deoxyphosphogalactonate aldolase